MTAQIRRIAHLRNYGVFRDFKWSANSLGDFKRFNLIYGWNGTGKTLLSRLFADLQKGERPTDCESIRIDLSDGGFVTNENFDTAGLEDRVRVFNKDFVDKNVFPVDGRVGPIFVLGEENVEQQARLDALGTKIADLSNVIADVEQIHGRADDARVELGTTVAREVRGLGWPSGMSGNYANYDRRDFFSDAERLDAKGAKDRSLDGKSKDRLIQIIRSELKEIATTLDFSFVASEPLISRAREICGRSVASAVIKDLEERSDVNDWVRQGLDLHHAHGTDTCLFCSQGIPQQRVAELEEHFSEEYSGLVADIDELSEELKVRDAQAKALTLPSPGDLYIDLRTEFSEPSAAFRTEQRRHSEVIEGVQTILAQKRENPFKDRRDAIPKPSFDDSLMVDLNGVIEKHNDRVKKHDDDVAAAAQKLVASIVAESWPKEYRLREGHKIMGLQIGEAQSEIDRLRAEQIEHTRKLTETLRPAEELNRDLAAYLGHATIQFQDEETGYRILRDGKPADRLSEGERTAIALLYFLKTLTDKDFDIGEGIVVIDDPISSLDANAVFNAFGFIRAKTEKAGQLFVLTHHFPLFRQAIRWFRQDKSKRKIAYRIYMLETFAVGDRVAARLRDIDPLLEKFESDYQFLFSRVYRAAENAVEEPMLEGFYDVPNAARRLLDTFLEFKYPNESSLQDRLRATGFDTEKCDRIERFCNTYSHASVALTNQVDVTALKEAPGVCANILELMEDVDAAHQDGMVALLN